MGFLPLVIFLSWLLYAVTLPSQAPQLVSARRGQDVLLECRGPPEADVSLFTWTKAGLDSDYVFFYRNDRSHSSHQHPSFRGRVELRDTSSMRDGDFSVVLQNVSEADEGSYRCDVVTRSSEGAGLLHITRVNLTVSGTNEDKEEEEEEEEEEEVTNVGHWLMLAIGVMFTVFCFVFVKVASSRYRLAKTSEVGVPEQNPGSEPNPPEQTE